MQSKTRDYLLSIGATARALPGTPAELIPESMYVPDGGYCIVAVPQKFSAKAALCPADYEVPVPSKYVITHGYTMQDGVVYCDVPYDSTYGVDVPEKYEVYDDHPSDTQQSTLTSISVGKPFAPLVGLPEGVRFAIDAGGAWAFACFNNPSRAEIDQFAAGMPLKVGLFYRSGILVMLFKFGSLEWVDAPYTPRIGTNPMQYLHAGQSLRLTCVLADAPSGTVKQNIRLVGLSEAFTARLKDILQDMLTQSFDQNAYNTQLAGMYNRYTTKDMVASAVVIQSI